jgi:hypothetical protein
VILDRTLRLGAPEFDVCTARTWRIPRPQVLLMRTKNCASSGACCGAIGSSTRRAVVRSIVEASGAVATMTRPGSFPF